VDFRVSAVLAVIAAGISPATAWAWGATGHEWVSGIAAEELPDEIPAFVRTPEAVADIAVFGRELDRSKGSGVTHDKERDPGHYVDLDDKGAVAGLALEALPETREAYDTALRAKGLTQYRAGYLPYSIVDGWQQLAKDFAYWRAATVGAEKAASEEDRVWFSADRRRREQLLIRDLGVWSHYVGDASQPLHVSEHFNGWGKYPNPRDFSTSKKIHAHFEGAFVRQNLDRADVKAAVAPYRPCKCSTEDRARELVLDSHANVEPLYELEKWHGFAKQNPRGVAFATARLAAGASVARDMIVDAWRASADMGVGYPMVSVHDIESGKVTPSRVLFGAD
jgi:hypothetical protein